MRIIQFFPYFLFGYAIKEGVIKLDGLPKKAFFIVSGALTIIIAMLASNPLFVQECQSTGLFRWCDTFNKSIVAGGGYYLLIKIASLANSFTVWREIKIPERFGCYGQGTLAVYVFNTMTFPLVYHYCTELWMSVFTAILTIILAIYLNKIGLAKFLTNPVSTIFNKYFYN